MPVLIIWLIIWVVAGLLIGALASLVVQGEPPYGLAVDIIVSIAATVAIGLLDYFIIPLMGFTNWIRLLAMLTEPLIGAGLVLWLLRVIKRRSGAV
jgi:uncharacterized membrane protein YeaQ/YmgE (transglycosylase-associated protein family)